MRSLTSLLIAANVAGFVLQTLLGPRVIAAFALWPLHAGFEPQVGALVGFEPWQLVSSAFLHGGPMHLGLNMLALHIFGRDVEGVLGARRFAALYFASVLVAALVQLAVVSWAVSGPRYPTVGASGGVFGILLAFATFFPRRTILLLFPPIPLPAWLFVTLYGALELANGLLGTQAGVAHFAHLGGMLGAWLTLRRWRRR